MKQALGAVMLRLCDGKLGCKRKVTTRRSCWRLVAEGGM